LPLIREIQGRTTDFVLAADGTVMHGLAVIYILRDLPGVQSFKIIQHDLMHTSVLVVPGSEFGPVQERAIQTGIRRRLGDSEKAGRVCAGDHRTGGDDRAREVRQVPVCGEPCGTRAEVCCSVRDPEYCPSMKPP